MTNKEVIYFLDEVRNILLDDKSWLESTIQPINEAFDRAISALQEQPEIVRCKGCKYWREHKYAKETKRYMPFCGFNAIYTKADDFCSRAERREE